MTDTALAKRLAADLDRAFPDFVTAMQSSVFNGARRWVPGPQDAEDVTQDVFVRAYQALRGYPSEQVAELRLRPWLFTITLNLCRNHARTRSRRPQQVALVNADRAHGDLTEQNVVDRLVIDEWRERLARLTARQRDAIVLHHVVGLTYDEIVEVVDRPAGTIRSDVHRGLDRLRTMITTEEL